MSKFKKGETSSAKLREKEEKTESIVQKIEHIKAAHIDRKRIPSLDRLMSSHGVSLKSALAWSDSDLGITSCSYNTAKAEHNKAITGKLVEALNIYNEIRPSTSAKEPTIKANSNKADLLRKIRNLTEENILLRNSLAEVYRAYEQLIARVDEKTKQDIRYQQVLKAHTQALGKADIRLIKNDN
ncbi:hypothetical protein N0480_12030 [Pseudomonas aeruginosa]|nr:hypothetical protein [Pseudomonas aeruginosa]